MREGKTIEDIESEKIEAHPDETGSLMLLSWGSSLETVYLLRSPANAQRLFAPLNRSIERDSQTPKGQTLKELCQELGIERNY